MRLIQQPVLQWVAPLKNTPVAQGVMYIGLSGQDPKIPENRVTVFRKDQLNEYVEVEQPISLSDSGVPIYLGQEMALYVEQDCSIRVDDRYGAEQYLVQQYFGAQDDTLRDDLAETDGSSLVNFGNIGGEANSSGQVVAGKLNALIYSKNTSYGVTEVDTHYTGMLGCGLLSTETANTNKAGYTVASTAAAGQKIVNLASNSDTVTGDPLVVGQLVCYVSTDGVYRSNIIDSISGTAITLKNDIPVSIGIGINFFSFMSNEAHPSKFGYRVLADLAIESQQESRSEVFALKALGSPTLTVNAASSFNNPGSSSVLAYDVTVPSAVNDGLFFDYNADTTGPSELNAIINPNGGTVEVRATIGAYTRTINVTGKSPRKVQFYFATLKGSKVTITVKGLVNGQQFSLVNTVKVLTPLKSNKELNQGKHVLLGDSWFVQDGIYARLQERLPDARIVNKGVGGNTAQQLNARFDSDVTPENPDFVWIICGTNDYYANISADDFNYQIQYLAARCLEIGAKVIFFNSSVGSADLSATRFNLSRRYANEVKYLPTILRKKRTQIFSLSQLVPDTFTGFQLINFGLFQAGTVRILSYYYSGADLTLGVKTAIGGTLSPSFALTKNALVTTPIEITLTAARFLDVRASNTSGGDLVTVGYVELELPEVFTP